MLERGLAAAPGVEQQLKATIATIEAYRKNHRDDRSSNLDWSFGVVGLASTSWNTAAATGALGYMDYSEVKGYTRVYVVQEEFLRLQQSTLAKWLELRKWGARLNAQGGFSGLSSEELSEVEAEVSAALVHTQSEEEIAKNLVQQYAKVLGEK